MYDYNASITRVVDGDTIDVAVDMGLHVTVHERFRLIGLNAPENSTPEGKAATAYLAELLPVGTAVRVVTHKDRREKYGRYLAEVFLGKGAEIGMQEESINDQIVKDGHAVAYDGGKR